MRPWLREGTQKVTLATVHTTPEAARAWMGVLVDSALRSAEERVSYAIMEERTISSFQYVSA